MQITKRTGVILTIALALSMAGGYAVASISIGSANNYIINQSSTATTYDPSAWTYPAAGSTTTVTPSGYAGTCDPSVTVSGAAHAVVSGVSSGSCTSGDYAIEYAYTFTDPGSCPGTPSDTFSVTTSTGSTPSVVTNTLTVNGCVTSGTISLNLYVDLGISSGTIVLNSIAVNINGNV